MQESYASINGLGLESNCFSVLPIGVILNL
jgi:hypothetical protein